MKALCSSLCLAAVMATGAQGNATSTGLQVDVVHYWISNSESAAIDVYRNAWTSAGNQWTDLPVDGEAALKRVVSERIANGYPPAVTQWNLDARAVELPSFGVTQDIEALAQRDHWRKLLPAFVIDVISYGDRIYFAPSNIHLENWLWTSQTIFNELGLAPPETWDELFATAERIEAAGYPAIAMGSAPWEAALIFHSIMYDTMGAEGYAAVFHGDRDAVLAPSMREALDRLRRVSRFTEPATARAGRTWADATRMIGRGEAGMQLMGDWAKGELVSLGYTAGQDFGCSFIPGTSATHFMAIDGFAFPLTARDGAAHAQHTFARMVLEPDNQLAFSRLKGSLPVRTDIDPAELDHCGQLGLQRIRDEAHHDGVHSRAMPSHTMAAWISTLSEFFDDATISSQVAQQRLSKIVTEG
ncbi:ABC transporter substrate-binding protein [Billgrantia antri]|uniref:Probable sugar-binding periplasmic protein n=1 Tax=Billgrantia antri TaxID=2846777 RepID=A0ABS6ZTP2_9GAMM|nr:ABC transporter substrate-binding protein [Halomonas antri]MBW6393436.1 ABC transporter substrate-binding protein [Halomonas antri]